MMLPGPKIIKECPGCLKPFGQMTMSSGNTFGAKLWSDRKIEAPMMIESKRCGICPNCNLLIWIDKSNEIDRVDLGSLKTSNYSNLKSCESPRIADYLKLLNDSTLSAKDEIYIRCQLLQTFNDYFRKGIPESSSSDESKKNKLRLIDLLGYRQDDLLLKAEIYRELGDFVAALSILEGGFDKNRQWVADKLVTLCLAKNTDIVVLDHS
jgi:hypothetical protein